MKPLLKITVMPLEYEMKVQHARLERSRTSPPVVEVGRSKGGLQMRSTPAKLLIDTYEARNSVLPDTKTMLSQAAQKGKASAAEAAQNYAQEASQMLWSKPGEGGEMLHQIFTQRSQMPTGQFQMAFLPAAQADITYQAGSLKTEYQMDKLAFQLKQNNGTTEYRPGSVDIIIKQYPDVKIEYMGQPLYVPPSAAKYFIGDHLDATA